jgi:hypothetical protein
VLKYFFQLATNTNEPFKAVFGQGPLRKPQRLGRQGGALNIEDGHLPFGLSRKSGSVLQQSTGERG